MCMNETIETILDRRSVRKFLGKPIEKEKIDLILRAGMAAPSARNRQPWKFFAVDNRDLLNSLADELPYAKMLYQAPLAIIVCGDIRDKEDMTAQTFWMQDCSAAVENILLAIQSLKLGAVWTACYPKEDRVEIPKRILNMPDGIIPLCVIPVGYPDGESVPVEKFKQENIIWNKFEG